MKGRLAWTFWLVVVLAVVTSTASYAWLAINTMARLRGFEVGAMSDSLYLEISQDATEDYGTKVSFDKTMYLSIGGTRELSLVSYGQVPTEGAIKICKTQVDLLNAGLYGSDEGTYVGGGQRFYQPSGSAIAGGMYNFVDVTGNLTEGDSIIGYYVVEESDDAYQKAQDDTGSDYVKNHLGEDLYYVMTDRGDGHYDYSCIGSFDLGETLAGRLYWGYATSNDNQDAEPDNIMNVVSMDVPTDEYCLKKTVYLRGAGGTNDASDLKISAVEIGGRQNYLTGAMRIMFVATSDRGRSVTTTYNHRKPGEFDGRLFDEIFGDRRETVTVDIYIYFDGRDEGAHNDNADFITSQTVNVHFSISDHRYN